MIRSVVFWLHLTVAVAAGLVILMLAATGAVLSLEETVTGLAERRYFVTVPQAADRLPADRLRPEGVALAAGLVATSLSYSSDPRAPVRVHEGQDLHALVDPYTGRVLARGPGGLERFFEGAHNWHRWFNVSGGSVRRARAVTGAVNVAFLFLLLTGPILWIPRPVTRRSLAQALLLRRGAKGAKRDFNWHQVVGIWSVLPLAVIAATGVATSYPAVGDRVYPTVGNVVPAGAWPAESASEGAGVEREEVEGDEVEGTAISGDARRAPDPDLRAALATAEAWAPEWRTLILHMPRPTDPEVRVEVRGGRAGQPHRAGRLTLDAATGSVRAWETFADDTPTRRAQQFLRYAHTGEYWGLPGQLLAGLFSLAAALMVWTGLSLAVRRLRRFVGLRRALRRSVRRPRAPPTSGTA
ncbi:MAG: PepSY-associated TM helix domain-containing protein [Gemmatimonadota bacterium]|uniref:PepSY-associated TM helix domain-containing protein n=1 Tax=Candidatus Palauibacter scopulicola TaxID=3056741 RepID=UPI002399F19D|nr:PepSY-associated TM helix domain-containing protein [Candidatus Palauibacter scopulicola]MDE2663827.1 PepSY-associated TM helix domain-containing protein [Candidatus Palauibacter scopulicola]